MQSSVGEQACIQPIDGEKILAQLKTKIFVNIKYLRVWLIISYDLNLNKNMHSSHVKTKIYVLFKKIH